MNNRLIKSNDAGGGGGCTNTVDLYNPFSDGGGVALYQLNGDATDVSGNYDGTATNVTYGAGQVGQAGVFNGSSSLIDLGTNSFSFTEVTVSMWVKFDSFTGTDCLFDGYYEAASVAYGYVCLSNSSNKVLFRSYNYPNYTDTVSTTTLSTGVWYHLAFVSNQSQASVYINGVLDATGSTVGISTNVNTRFTLGAFRYAGGTVNYFDGSIDQARIFSRVLRPYEVEALYTEEYCTPTIVPSEHFNTVLYTGNGTSQSITGVGFQPDLVWAKSRSISQNNVLATSVQGVYKGLISNLTIEEFNSTETLTSFDSDGFSIGNNLSYNTNNATMVAWNFKAGGAAVTNTDGTITSQVSANTEAGFSIVKFTGSLTSGQTVGHGLTEAPSVVILKDLDSVANWYIYHQGTGTTSGYINYLRFDATAGDYSDKIFYPINFNSSTFTPGNDETVLQGNVIAYCFAEVEGFSSFGSYVGTGASGNTIVTGFEPAFVMIKNATTGSTAWNMVDNKRNTGTTFDNFLQANTSIAEAQTEICSITSNGFTVSGNVSFNNSSGDTFIYMAFAADPTAVEPTLEDSFNTVVYSGNNSTNPVSTVGFQPDLVWIKSRTVGTQWHNLFDSVRGVGESLYSNATTAEEYRNNSLLSFDDNGFTVGDWASVNLSGTDNYVSWNWKGAEIPAINSNGSIPSVVSANPAAGFSIVNWTSNGVVGATVGHGLSSAPSMIILKDRSNARNWLVYHSAIGATGAAYLNLSDAADTGLSQFWNNTSPTDSVFSVSNWTNEAGSYNIISYCFAEVAGFSKFGSYNGTGVNGNFIATGFEPAFVMVKRTNAADNWVIVDNKRGTSNSLFPDSSSQELFNSGAATFSSTGFTVNGASGGWNNASSTYIYMAFANQF